MTNEQRAKEIEGMATKMTEFCRKEGCQRSGGQICQSNVCGKCSSQIMYEDIAAYLYAADYRKQSDTVQEFAEKLKIELKGLTTVIKEIDKIAASFGGEDNDANT